MTAVSATPPTPDDAVPTVTVTQAHERPSGVLLLDVREPAEWAEGHAPGAVLRPLGQLDASELPAGSTVYVICRSGNRSTTGTRILRSAGLDARNVDGGMIAWTDAHLPLRHD